MAKKTTTPAPPEGLTDRQIARWNTLWGRGQGQQAKKAAKAWIAKNKETNPEKSEEEKAQEDKERTIAETNDLINAATTYGDTLPDKYIPQGTFGTIDTATTPEMRAYLDMLRDTAQTAGQYTDYETDALAQMKSGLQGYSAPEVQAMRESAAQELDRQYQTQMAMQALSNARGGVRGRGSSAAMQDLQQNRMEAGGNLERDLIVQNAQEIQGRRTAFAQTVRQTEDARFGRQNQSQGQYGGFLAAEEGARTGREQYNIGQAQNEALARSGLAMTGTGSWLGVQGGQEAANVAKEQANAWLEFQKAEADRAAAERERVNKAISQALNQGKTITGY